MLGYSLNHARIGIICSVSFAHAIAQPLPPNPVPPDRVVSDFNLVGTEGVFVPLAPQFSDYWIEGTLHDSPNAGGLVLPPPPLGENPYPMFYPGAPGYIGSALSTRALVWKGVHVPGSSPDLWEFDTYTYPDGTFLNWHNAYQYTLSVSHSDNLYPPAWPEGGVLHGPFSDWVDLYAPYLSRAFFTNYIAAEMGIDSWHQLWDSFGRYGFPRVGSPQHVDLPPTYPPQATSAWASTSPLVPASDGDTVGVYGVRETVAGRLDLLTGEPLLQETDLVLPFGSAVFRRLRTYSERPDHGVKADSKHQQSQHLDSWIRGWHGSGWMSSEMPLFFFDASQAGTITTGGENPIGPVCYFVPDAHHAIPFVQQPSVDSGPPNYVAPDWFDAMLLYDREACEWGVVNPGAEVERVGWITPPREMKVYLQNRSVIYTIKMYYEDVDPIQHRRPEIDANGFHSLVNETNYGVPYYGLVTSIRDKAGNRVAITYADQAMHRPFWDQSDLALQEGEAEVKMLVRQRGWYKGMIDCVKLYPSGESQAQWSIFYTYRTFFSERTENDSFFHLDGTGRVSDFVDYFDSRSHPPALHSLLVYKRDVDGSEISPVRELILPCDTTTFGPAEHISSDESPPAFVDLLVSRDAPSSDPGDLGAVERVFAKPAVGEHNNQFDHQDVAIGPTGEGDAVVTVLPSDWLHQVRFSYADPLGYGEFDTDSNTEGGLFSPFEDYSIRSCGPARLTHNYSVARGYRSAYLLKSAVHSRAESAGGELRELPPQYWLYRYQDVMGPESDVPDPYPAISGKEYWSYGSSAIVLPRRMSHRYGPETIGRIYRNRPDESLGCDINAFVNGLIGIDEDRYVAGALCNLEPPSPPGPDGPQVDPEPGGRFGYTDFSPYDDPGNQDGSGSFASTTHSLDELETNNLPVGLLADTIYFRWHEAYRLDPRLNIPSDTESDEPELIARPASWALFDGRFDGATSVSPFFQSLRDDYVGGSVSNDCEDLLADDEGRSIVITQADESLTGFLPGGAGLYSAIADDGTAKWYRIYRFITAPDNPVEWRGSIYESESGSGATPLGPEVIWDKQGASSGGVGDDPSGLPNKVTATHALYYYPFNFVAFEWGAGIDDAQVVNIDRAKPMWWCVVDEYASVEEALATNSSLAFPEEAPLFDRYSGLSGAMSPWLSRRVVGMNSTGAVLSDRTWVNDGETIDTSDPPAVLEAWAFDDHYRPILKFSRGWGAAAAMAFHGGPSEMTNGLVEVFRYETPYLVNMGSPGHGAEDVYIELAPRTPLEKWIRKGCTPNDIKVSSVDYYGGPDGQSSDNNEWRAKLPKKQTYYDLLGAEIGTVEHFYGHWDPAVLPDDEEGGQPPLRWKIRIGPPHQRSPGAPFVRAIDGQWFNKKGNLVWEVSGAMVNPFPDDEGHIGTVPDAGGHTGPHPADEVFLNYSQYDEEGRQILHVEDIGIDTAGSGFTELDLVHPGHPTDASYGIDPEVELPHWQDMPEVPHGTLLVGSNVPADDVTPGQLELMLGAIGLDRTSLLGPAVFRQAQAEPLNLVTFWDYNNFGPFKVVHPTGLRDMFHYEVQSEWLRELRAKGIDLDGGSWRWAGQSLYQSEFEGQAFTEGIQAAIDELIAGAWSGSPYDLESQVFQSNRLEVIAHLEPNYDTAGRLTSLTVADSVDAADTDGIKTVTAYDGWGNPLLEISPDKLITRYRYDGIGRLHKTFMGSDDRNFRWGTDTGANDDLILTEKIYYGNSPTDASMPITKWMYRERSDSQYDLSEWFEPSDDQTGDGPAFTSGNSQEGRSSPGRVEHYEYDWRMRRVITKYQDFQSSAPEIYREERTFLDNIDRVRFVAVYAPTAPASAPHPDIDPGSDLPAAADFLVAGASDGLLSLDETIYNGAGQVVERRRYDPEGSGGYLVTHSYTDHADRALWSSSSGGRVTKNVYDARGRLVTVSEFAGDGPGAIELTRTKNFFGPAGNIEQSWFYERAASATTGTTLETSEHRLSVTYNWYDSSSRIVAVADMGSANYDGQQYDRAIPSRPDQSPERVENINTFVGNSDEYDTRRLLVGVEYPDDYFDPATGDPLARITCYWYGRSGQQNAVLSVHSAHRDPATGEQSIEYTIDRTEYNRYGQKVLEHQYAYAGDGTTYLEQNFELLGGTEYEFDTDIWFPSLSQTINVNTGQVRRITPLVIGPDSPVVSVVWESDTSTRQPQADDFEDIYTISGAGRFVTSWQSNADKRSTILEYGAPIIQPNFDLPPEVLQPDPGMFFPLGTNDWDYLGISRRPDLIKAVHLPDPDQGLTGDGLGYSLFFFYYPDGLPAIRVDSRGIAIKYIYDSDGNLTNISSNDANMPLVADLGMLDEQLPSNAIRYVYDALSRLQAVQTAREYADGSSRIDTESRIAYDSLGNMLHEEQDRFDLNGTLTASGTVQYSWDTRLRHSNADPVNQTNNVSRLHSITYPQRVGTHDGGAHSPRVVTLGYGPAGGISDLLDRVESLTSTGGPAGKELGHVATYRYDGLSRLQGIDLGNVPGQPTGTFAHTDNRQYDLFGRVIDRHVTAFDTTTGTHITAMHSGFGYDLRGQRLYERLSQQSHPQLGSRNNTHSWFYDYDRLGRLVGEHHGTLLPNGFEGIDHAASTIAPLRQLYALDSLNRRVGSDSAPGISIWEDINNDANPDQGELLQQTHVIDQRGGLTGLEDGTSTEPVAQDISGAITGLHGREIYHDWLGRPVLALNAAGDAVFAVTYDGFGRVARRSAPWPDSPPEDNLQRDEIYFCDGVRRIQEVFDDPKPAIPPWPTVPGSIGGGGGSGGNERELRTEAEFIWSAAGAQPFDTCHVQIDWWDREAWYIQDHQTGTVRAYTDESGEMARQYRFDAFGNLLSADEFPLAKSGGLMKTFQDRLGHHGLFAERVDTHTRAKLFNPSQNPELWYQSRSRWYVPELGRFMTPDPNATGIPVVSSLAMLGKLPNGPPSTGFGWESHYGDGWDLQTAYGASPLSHQDATGLFFFTLGDVVSSDAARKGMKAYGTYDKLDPAIGFAKNVMSGLSYQQALISIAADAVFDIAGGKIFEKAVSSFGKSFKSAGAWGKSWSDRGLEIENMLGGNLPRNFPVIDRFENGIATSIKSLDLDAATYQSQSKLRSKVKGYINTVADFDGASMSDVRITSGQVKFRSLELAVPFGATQSQLAVFEEMRSHAIDKGVRLFIVVVP